MRKIYPIFIFLFGSLLINGQHLVEAELVESLTATSIFASFGIPAVYDVDSYKVRYMTPDINGQDHVATGLITIPKDETKIFPLLAMQHGTVGDRTDVPSNLDGGYQLGMLGASLGYIAVQADYLGLGESPGIHPYIHWESEAWAARDLLRAAREFAEDKQDINYNEQVFVSGYSQGGHGAMALHKLLEQNHDSEFDVTASSPMSGPYSVSDKMVEFTLGDDEYFFCAYLAWVTLSMQVAYPVELADWDIEDVYQSQYVSMIQEFVDEDITLWELNNMMIDQLNADVGKVTPKDMLKPEILDALKNDPSHPLSMALQKNDLDDWAPDAPTRLMYCTGDDQVTFRNAIHAEEQMNALGAYDLLAVENGETLDHGGCVTPALTNTIIFFLNYREISEISAVDQFGDHFDGMKLFQNGTDINYLIDNEIVFGKENKLLLYNMNGSLLKIEDISEHSGTMDIANNRNGMYVVGLFIDGKTYQLQKIFIQ